MNTLFTTTEQRGFTLIEVMVSLSIFTFVAVAAVGVLLTLINANSRSQNIQTAMLDLSFVLDSMTRDIRTGLYYYCGGNSNSYDSSSGNPTADCVNGSTRFAFSETGGSLTGSCSGGNTRVAFQYNAADKSIERVVCGGTAERLTAPEVEVTDFSFTLSGSDSSDTLSPLVTIFVAGQVTGKGGKTTDFSLQTTVTQNTPDIP